MSKDEEMNLINKLEGAHDYARKLDSISDSEERKVITAAIDGILVGYNLSKGVNHGA